ncbi:MAG: isochorismate synthase [Flavobacteriaceae bacterium]|nr:isochorismate synthase [Flavobacteriaceae bacterium]
MSNLLSEDIPIDNEAKAEYLKMVNKGLEEIRQGRLEKVVLSRKISIPNSKHPLELFKLLELNYPDAMVYCFFHPQSGIWLGATPETLAQIENNVLTTVSLAGTKLFNETIPAVWTEKEKREQQIVTDYILQALEESSAEISVSGPETIQAGQVIHLRSVIRAELVGDYSVKSLLEKLHPTPAVCGMPRNEAYKFIMDNETYDREFYTGFLGELNLSEGPEVDLYVNLRCMQLFPEEARVFVGGGITSESIPEHEWLETVDKSKTMVKVIAF